MDKSILICLILIPSSRSDVVTLSEEVARTYFRGYSCIVYLHDRREAMTLKSTNPVIMVNPSTWKTLGGVYEGNCRGFIVQVSDRTQVIPEIVTAYKKSSNNRYNNRRYLFLPVDERDTDLDFFSIPEMYFMPNFIFAYPLANNSGFALLTHNYFDGYKYEVLNETYTEMDVWTSEKGFQRNAHLFQDGIVDLRGKQMVFAVMQYSPYTLVIKEKDDLVYDGLETRIAAEFAATVNATWTGKDHPDHLWGDLFENGTGNGVIGSVYEHTADIGFAAIYQWHCDVMDCSYPYIYAGVTCLVPKPLPVQGWHTIFLPYQSRAWVGLLIAYFTSSSFVFIGSSFLRNLRRRKTRGIKVRIIAVNDTESWIEILQESFFNTFRLHLEQPTKRILSNGPFLGFFRMWSLYCFFMAVCWQAGIAAFLTVPRYEDPINDIYDLTSRWPKIEWGGNHIDWIKSIAQSTEPEVMKIVNDFTVLDDNTLRRRVRERNFGFFMERLPNGHYGMNDYIDDEAMKYLRIMESNVYTANVVMILPKCSPYLESLDRLLFWMFDTGLIQKLEVQVSLERINNRLQNMVRTSTEKSSSSTNIALLLDHIQGALFIYAFGVLLSGLGFFGELMYHRRTSKRDATNYLKHT